VIQIHNCKAVVGFAGIPRIEMDYSSGGPKSDPQACAHLQQGNAWELSSCAYYDYYHPRALNLTNMLVSPLACCSEAQGG
jgi:hypothetical protein